MSAPADPECAPLRQRQVSQAIKQAVEWQLGKPAKELQLDLYRCQNHPDGFTEATLVCLVKKTGRVHTFKVSVDANGVTTSVRHDAVHVRADGGGWTGQEASAAKKQEIGKWVWISVACAIALAIIITIIVLVVKYKQNQKDAAVGAVLRTK